MAALLQALLVSLGLGSLVGMGAAVELTPKNWNKKVAGKTVFVKFFAPWCGHCKKLKPAWDRLATDFQGSPTALVAEVDCTAKGKPLCAKHEVSGYPRLMWGQGDKLELYTGARTYEEMKRFADGHLGKSCGPGDLGLCGAGRRELFEKFLRIPPESLDRKIKLADEQLRGAEVAFAAVEQNMSRQIAEAERDRDQQVKDIKAHRGLPQGASGGSFELTPDTWDGRVEGKTIFVKFFAPWCGHCKAIKHDWERLMADFEGTRTSLVAEVDCTGKGKALCEQHGVTGFPRLLWGEADEELKVYSGARGYKELRAFADEHLGRRCSPAALELCEGPHRDLMEKLAKLSPDALDSEVQLAEKKIQLVEQAFTDKHWGLLLQIDLAEQKKDKRVKEIQEQGLAEAKEVQAWNSEQPPGFWAPPPAAGPPPQQEEVGFLQRAVLEVAGVRLTGLALIVMAALAAVAGVSLATAWRGPAGASCSGRHILMEREEELLKAKARVEAGEDFGAVAKECSKCHSGQNGGRLGERVSGSMTPELDRVCFDPGTEVGKLLGPIKSKFGYHLLIIDSRRGVPGAPEAETRKDK